MKILRTADERFASLPDFPFQSNYTEISDGLRVHYIDEGDENGETVLMLHGEPTWGYLYRFMIPVFAANGFRAIAPDLIGFGRSDKPSEINDYTYKRMVDWTTAFIVKLDLNNINLVCQDWGSLIGLRIAAENPERFARISLANGGLPTAETEKVSEAFKAWKHFAKNSPVFPIGQIINKGCERELSKEEIAAYDAPFPDDSFKAGTRAMPLLVPVDKDDVAVPDNIKAREVLAKWQKPFVTCFSDNDPITKGGEKWFQQNVAGAKNRNHVTIENAGHFLQEDKGAEWAQITVDFIKNS